ncbi:MAG TPA: helix-turn-helix domain-containing protein [Caproiciproducens sp.]|nr:helix-turn-helix domain-containing protein [Caproiciproducens sp.]
MTPKEKHRSELDTMILKRKQGILDQAIVEFCRNGIENTTMGDIAKASEVGIASLYRYFASKTELVVQCAIRFWKIAEELFFPPLLTRQYDAMTGLDQIKQMGTLLIKVYDKYKEFLIFLNDFESFLRKEKISRPLLMNYETEFMQFKPYFVKALEKGIQDHTIKPKYGTSPSEVENTFLILSQIVISYAQKLAVYSDILKPDREIDTNAQIEAALTVLVDAIRLE